jgi:branched-chain amino acid transport system permease protein
LEASLKPLGLERFRSSVVNPNVWFWAVLLVLGGVLPTFYVDDYVYSVLVLFGLYGAINLMWSLVIGTAGILSFATLAIVGVGAYVSTYLSVNYGWNWPEMFAISIVAGAILGALVAAPAIRLRGVYFALLTFGLVELFRSFASLRDDLGLAYGLFGAKSFVPDRFTGTETGAIIAYYAGLGLLVVALLVYWAIDGGRLGLLLRTARESESVAKAVGIEVVRARFAVFVISSGLLGLAGAFYASYYQGVSPSIFDFGKVLLLFAMMVVGGMWSARGVLIGTALLLFIDQHFLSSGPSRLIAIGALMLVVTLVTERGLDGVPSQVQAAIARVRAGPGSARGTLAGGLLLAKEEFPVRSREVKP